jgi:hypothetical protein
MKNYLVAEEVGLKTPNGTLVLGNDGNITCSGSITAGSIGTTAVSGDFTIQGGDLYLVDTNEVVSSNGTDMFFTVGGSEVVRFKAGGNVGIGTNNPSCLFDLYGANANLCLNATSGTANIEIQAATDQLSFIDFGEGNDFNGRILYDNSTNKLHFYVSSGTEAVVIGSTGNVGIGSASATQKLDVNGDALIGGGDLYLVDTNEIISSNGTDMYFTVGGSERMRILGTTGAIGIGTNNPTTDCFVDITSTTGAFLPPRMTTTQRDALTPTDGMIIFNSTIPALQCYYSSTWNSL